MDFLGLELNSSIKNGLSEAMDSGRFPHAAVIEGGSHSDRLKLARLLAASLVCNGKGEKPCLVCSSCLKSFAAAAGKKKPVLKALEDNLRHPDIAEVEKEKDRVQFGVRVVSPVIENAYIVPNEADLKVYIFPDAEVMTAQAQNAMLKILEEPPGYIRFILLCESRNSLLTTVLSRVACFNLGAVQPETSSRSKKPELARQAAAKLARAITAPRDYDLLIETAVFEKDNQLLELSLAELELIIRDALVVKSGGELLSSSPDAAKVLAKALPVPRLLNLAEEVRKLDDAVKRSCNNTLLISRLCSRLRA